jgi:hypothetical protein
LLMGLSLAWIAESRRSLGNELHLS